MKLDSYLTQTRKSKFKMDQKLKRKTQNYKNPRRKHRRKAV